MGGGGQDADVPGFCKSALLAEVREDGHVLTLGRSVGVEPVADDAESVADDAESATLKEAIRDNVRRLGVEHH